MSPTAQDRLRPHLLRWVDQDFGTAISCIEYSQWPYYECDKKIRMCILQSFKLGTQFIIEMYLFFIDHLNCLLGSTSPYMLCNLKWEKSVDTRLLNTFPTHFRCISYCTYKLMLIQTPVSEGLSSIKYMYNKQFLQAPQASKLL